MLNQIVLVGRLTSDPEIKELEEGMKYSYITIAIPRSFKNADGEYDTDFVQLKLWNAVAENTKEYCNKGDIIGVKGRVESYTIENEDGTKETKMELVAEKITFLSSKSSKEED